MKKQERPVRRRLSDINQKAKSLMKEIDLLNEQIKGWDEEKQKLRAMIAYLEKPSLFKSKFI